MKTLIAASLIALFSSTVVASNKYEDYKQVFKCTLPQSDFTVIAIIADGVGFIEVLDESYFSTYEQRGFARTWSFGPVKENDAYPYTFIIEPDMTGLYYDFSMGSEAKPSYRLKCKSIYKKK